MLGKNGKASSSKQTRHINIRYFFVADCVQAKEMKFGILPYWDMIADFFTNPLQGSLFKRLHDDIMNKAPVTHDLPAGLFKIGRLG